MENEFQQDYDIRDCAAIKVSTLLDNLHILKIKLESCIVRQQSVFCVWSMILAMMGGKNYIAQLSSNITCI